MRNSKYSTRYVFAYDRRTQQPYIHAVDCKITAKRIAVIDSERLRSFRRHTDFGWDTHFPIKSDKFYETRESAYAALLKDAREHVEKVQRDLEAAEQRLELAVTSERELMCGDQFDE